VAETPIKLAWDWAHTVENVGEADVHAVIVELKQPHG
jgi:hypothetical protein